MTLSLGSLTYASAIREAHPDAHHISDQFHLVKNLTDAITQCSYVAKNTEKLSKKSWLELKK